MKYAKDILSLPIAFESSLWEAVTKSVDGVLVWKVSRIAINRSHHESMRRCYYAMMNAVSHEG